MEKRVKVAFWFGLTLGIVGLLAAEIAPLVVKSMMLPDGESMNWAFTFATVIRGPAAAIKVLIVAVLCAVIGVVVWFYHRLMASE